MTAKYANIQSMIQARIEQGELAPGDPLPSEREMAVMYGVSRITIRGALDKLEQEGYVIRRQGAGTFVEPAAARSATSDVYLVGVRHKNDAKAFLEEVGECLSAALLKRKQRVVLMTVPEGRSLIDYCGVHDVDFQRWHRVLFAGYIPTDSEIRLLREYGCRMVLIGRPQGKELIPYVEGDHHTGAKVMTRHFLEHGCRRIALLAGPNSLYINPLRINGFREAHAEAGLDCDESLIVEGVAWQRESGEAFAEMLLGQPRLPDAALIFGDWAFLGAYMKFREHGVRIPQDLRLGMGDWFSWLERIVDLSVAALYEDRQSMVDLALDIMDRQDRSELVPMAHRLSVLFRPGHSCGCDSLQE
ncbi:MAG: GntR family transcriptional regulator [Lentisphaerae bacterium]|nr:MAG: GntR family transcriptional regulator [Lentisphaerota bacterium]